MAAYRELESAELRQQTRHPMLIDARNFLDGRSLRALGFDTIAIGQ